MFNEWICTRLAPGAESSVCASWVQAWGSIAAIVAAVFVVVLGHYLQQRAKKRDEEAAYTVRLEYAYQIVDGTAKIARKILEFAEPAMPGVDDRRAMLVEVQAYCDAVLALDKSQLKTVHLVRAVLSGDALARKLREDLAVTLDERLGPNLQAGWLHAKVTSCFAQLQDSAETIAIALRERRQAPYSVRLIREV